MTGLLYFFVILAANTLGAISGMGGGILIKPIFDFIGKDTVSVISFYSAVSVFIMAIVSTFRQIKSGVKLNLKFISWIAVGSLVGGWIGNHLLVAFLRIFSDDVVLLIQICITVLTILIVLIYRKLNFRSYNLNSTICFLGCGSILGFFASFLSIGGGPINVALMMFMFSVPLKSATIYSICTILFSQGIKLVSIFMGGWVTDANLSYLILIGIGATLGGYYGSIISDRVSVKHVEGLFQIMMFIVIIINIYNGIKIFV